MGLFNKNKKSVDVNLVKEFLAQNGIKWTGGVISAFHKDKRFLSDIENKDFNKLINKPVRLLISSEILKDVDVITADISKDEFYLYNVDKQFTNVNLSSEWKNFQEMKKTQESDNLEREM